MVGARGDTAAACLAAASGQLSPLLGESVVAGLVSFAERIPAALSLYLGIEIRLDAPASGADLLAHVDRPSALADSGVRSALAPEGPDLLLLAAALQSAPPGTSEPLVHGWLEWDLRRADAERPSVFAGLSRADKQAVVGPGPVFEALTGRRSPPPIHVACERLAGTLSPGTRAMQIGVMAPPRDRSCRVVVEGLWSRSVDAIVEAGWPGERRDLEGVLEPFVAIDSPVAVDIDLGEDGIAPGIGVELLCDDTDTRSGLLAATTRSGLCDPEVADALDSARAILRRQDVEHWPGRLARTEEFMGDRVACAITVLLNHVKVTVPAGEPPYAKAYLAVRAVTVGLHDPR